MMYKLTLVASFTGNPVFTVSTKDPSALNEKPTIDTLIEDVKVLNGVGEIDNSVLSEQWSSRVASALFEHEQMIEISSMSEFDLTNYPESTMKLASQFKAVANSYRAFLKAGGDYCDALRDALRGINLTGCIGGSLHIQHGLQNDLIILVGAALCNLHQGRLDLLA